MCDGSDKERTTDPDVYSTVILEGFQDIKKSLEEIKERLDRLEGRQEKVEDRLSRVVKDLHIMHVWQKGLVGRMVEVEQHILDEPLQSSLPDMTATPITPTPRRVPAAVSAMGWVRKDSDDDEG